MLLTRDYYSISEAVKIINDYFEVDSFKLNDCISLIFKNNVDLYIELDTKLSETFLTTDKKRKPLNIEIPQEIKRKLSKEIDFDGDDVLFINGEKIRGIYFSNKIRISGFFKLYRKQNFLKLFTGNEFLFNNFCGICSINETQIEVVKNNSISEVFTLNPFYLEAKDNGAFTEDNIFLEVKDIAKISKNLKSKTSLDDFITESEDNESEQIKRKYSQAKDTITQLQKDNQELKAQIEELQAELKKKDDQPSDKIISGKSETAYLNLIHALKETCLSNETFENQEKLIKDLSEMYTGYTGLSESNLRDKFSKSKDLK